MYYRSTFAAVTVIILAAKEISQTAGQSCSTFDLIHNFSCPSGESISAISGEHNNRVEDRRYCYICQSNSRRAAHCYQTGLVNEYDYPVATLCRPNYYIAGIYSVHDSRTEDRRFDYKCCKNTNQCTRNCSLVGPENNFDGYLFYTLDPGEVMVGAFSWHNNDNE